MPVVRMATKQARGTGADIARFLADSGLENVFNPSVVVSHGRLHVAFRALGPDGEKPFHAYYAVRGSDGSWQLENLTRVAAEWGVSPVADPKLCSLDDGIFATFNTGTPLREENDVYVMAVWPAIEAPRRCELGNRQRIEKNWAFLSGDGGLQAIYSISPLILLEECAGSDAVQIRFMRTASAAVPERGRVGKRLSLGTPVLAAKDERLLMITHEKLWFRGRRSYVGRPVSISGLRSARPEVTVSRRRLVHTLRDALPQRRPTHNPNLLSATYFAGLTSVDDAYLLSYGINDVGFGTATVGAELWSR